MTVFRIYMKIAKKNMWVILMYLVIFFGITVMFQQFARQDVENYAAESIPVGIVDKDGGTAARSLAAYIGRTNKVVMLEEDREALQEDLFYRNVDYIIRIPEQFMEKCILGDDKVQVTAVPGSYTGYYVEQQMNNFLNFARTYGAAGFSEDEIGEAMSEREIAEVELVDFSGNAGRTPAYAYFYRYLPYLFLSVLCYVLGYILMGFRRGSLPRRMKASAMPARVQTLQGLGAAGVLALGLWGICSVAVVFLYGSDFLGNGRSGWYLLNSFVMLLCALSLAFLVGSLVKSSNALNGITNLLGLGMCFLCGVFVDMDLLSSGVRRAAQFLPVYWYENVNIILTEHGNIGGNVRMEVLGGIGIQLVFAAVFVCLTLAAAGEKNRKGQ